MSAPERDMGPTISAERRSILAYIDERIGVAERKIATADPEWVNGMRETAHRLRALRTDLRQCLDRVDEVAG